MMANCNEMGNDVPLDESLKYILAVKFPNTFFGWVKVTLKVSQDRRVSFRGKVA